MTISATPSLGIGSLIGKALNVTVSAVTVTSVSITANGGEVGNIGGLIGHVVVGVGSRSQVIDSSATVDISSTEGSLGGLIGYAEVSGEFSVTNSDATGALTGTGQELGGLIGYAWAKSQGQLSVSDSHATGAVTGDDSVGGLIGVLDLANGGTVTTMASFWDIVSSGVTVSAAGEGKTTTQMKQLATFTESEWSITRWPITISTWGLCADGTVYPFLMWQIERNSWQTGRPACTVSSSGSTPPPGSGDLEIQPPTPTTPTLPGTSVPGPVLGADGAPPALVPGASEMLVNGKVETVNVSVDNATDLVIAGNGFELRLSGQCSDACDITTDAGGRQVLTLESQGQARVEGSGFQPGTPVYVWLFSEPTFLGELTMNSDGSFSGSVPLGDIVAGEHTLQISGVSPDGTALTANIGVQVITQQTTTPGTGNLPAAGTNPTLLALTALIMLYLGLVATSRRSHGKLRRG